MSIEIFEADLQDDGQANALVALIDSYARDPMGGGQPLAEDVRRRLAPALRAKDDCVVFLAREADRTIGAALCFVGFSSFDARSLLNVHDLVVEEGFRGRGVGHSLLDAVAEKGRALGCCRVTLEVREDNTRARGLYERVGFRHLEAGDRTVPMFFMAKEL